MIKVAKMNGTVEMFFTIQGEGKNIGYPSIFLRLALCNLKCTWCDTKYTWDWKNFDFRDEVTEINEDDLINELFKFDCKHLVITGGEPMLQQKKLIGLITKLDDYFIEIETNGTIKPTDEFSSRVTQFNVSPKLLNSGNKKNLIENEKALLSFSENSKAFFKFVISDIKDLEEVNNMVEKYHMKRNRIYLMPQGQTKDEIASSSKWLIEVCKRNNFLFSPRLHVMIYDYKRGV